MSAKVGGSDGKFAPSIRSLQSPKGFSVTGDSRISTTRKSKNGGPLRTNPKNIEVDVDTIDPMQAAVDVQKLKETIHNLQLKDAIHRQDLQKSKRDNQELKTKIAEMEKTITKLERTKEIDGKYLLRQEEELRKLQQNSKYKGSENEVVRLNRMLTEAMKEKQFFEQTIQGLQDNFHKQIESIRDEFDIKSETNRAIAENPHDQLAAILKKQVEIFDQRVLEKEQEYDLLEAKMERRVAFAMEEKLDVEEELQDLKKDRIEDHKMILDLERRLECTVMSQQVDEEYTSQKYEASVIKNSTTLKPGMISAGGLTNISAVESNVGGTEGPARVNLNLSKRMAANPEERQIQGRAEEILSTLKTKLLDVNQDPDDEEESRFLRKLDWSSKIIATSMSLADKK